MTISYDPFPKRARDPERPTQPPPFPPELVDYLGSLHGRGPGWLSEPYDPTVTDDEARQLQRAEAIAADQPTHDYQEGPPDGA